MTLAEKLNADTKAAREVNWFNFPRTLALCLFWMVDVLIEICGELKTLNGKEGLDDTF